MIPNREEREIQQNRNRDIVAKQKLRMQNLCGVQTTAYCVGGSGQITGGIATEDNGSSMNL